MDPALASSTGSQSSPAGCGLIPKSSNARFCTTVMALSFAPRCFGAASGRNSTAGSVVRWASRFSKLCSGRPPASVSRARSLR